MNQQIQSVPFHGDTVDAIQTETGSWVVSLRRMCENLGVDYSNQLKKLKEKPWAVVVINTMTGADGKTYEMTMIDRRTLTMWLAGINPGKVRSELRAKIEAYQCEAADALDKYFNEGAAIRTPQPIENADIALAKALLTPKAVAGILTALDETQQQNRELAARNAQLEPKAQALDDFTNVAEAMTIRDAAGFLRNAGFGEMRETILRQWMLTHKWIYRKGTAYRAYSDRLDAHQLKYSYAKHQGVHRNGVPFDFEPTVYVTRKGLALLHQRISEEQLEGTLVDRDLQPALDMSNNLTYLS